MLDENCTLELKRNAGPGGHSFLVKKCSDLYIVFGAERSLLSSQFAERAVLSRLVNPMGRRRVFA